MAAVTSNNSKADLDLVARARTGDTEAWADLKHKYFNGLLIYLQRKGADEAQAEDVASWTENQALTSLEGYTGKGSFKAWLYTIAWHRLVDLLDKSSKTECVQLEELYEPASSAMLDPSRIMARKQHSELCYRLIRILPPSQQDAVMLVHIDEMSYEDAGEVLGRSKAAVAMLVNRALSTLRTYARKQKLGGDIQW